MSTYLLTSNNDYLTFLAKQLGVVMIYINIKYAFEQHNFKKDFKTDLAERHCF